MSFTPQPELDGELARAREQELEAKAARHAELHPDDQPRQGPVAGLLKALRLRLRRS
jgi:molybdopterin-guanine dinucleotide biosynthesis protein A